MLKMCDNFCRTGMSQRYRLLDVGPSQNLQVVRADVGFINQVKNVENERMNKVAQTLAPGARVVVRDAEWLVRKVDRTSTGGLALSVVGISELVRNKEAIFLTEVEPTIEILDPAKTKLVQDTSSSYQASLLYMESLLRQAPPTDDNLYLGHRAAMDAVPYQLDPAIQALQQPRQRILIADAVGLGKTLEAGVLLSELIRRGRGEAHSGGCRQKHAHSVSKGDVEPLHHPAHTT